MEVRTHARARTRARALFRSPVASQFTVLIINACTSREDAIHR